MTSIHQEKDQKPTHDNPNINTIDFQNNFKNFIRRIKERQQLFMKTIEGTHLNIQHSIMLLIFIASGLTF
jgi:tRNA U34 2-thiouridine synthase MnmA/TrmU